MKGSGWIDGQKEANKHMEGCFTSRMVCMSEWYVRVDGYSMALN